MDITYRPYIDPQFQLLIERIHPPRVCVDNETYPGCTLVKVDSANKPGMLLEMVQVLADLDLVISKSYISSDGGWVMDVFHVTDQHGNKLTDETLIRHIKETICTSRQSISRLGHMPTDHVALEMTGIDRQGLMSEMSAVLSELGCHITAAVAWTHKGRAACIFYVEDSAKHGLIMDPNRVSQVQSQLENVVEAHHEKHDRRSVSLSARAVPTERRLHQLMAADKDYEECCSCCGGNDELSDFYVYDKEQKGCNGTHVKIENCKEMDYSIINVRCRDRPKLLFDTVCTLTDLEYVVHHAAIRSQGSIAFQEYYVKHKRGYTLDSQSEKQRVTQCLVAATQRRVSHGLRLEICTRNRTGLLSDVTRVLRENGVSINRAEIGIRGEKAIGTFYVKDTTGKNVNPETVEIVRQKIGGCIVMENISWGRSNSGDEERPKSSLGNMVWAQLERLLANFRLTQS